MNFIQKYERLICWFIFVCLFLTANSIIDYILTISYLILINPDDSHKNK